MDLHPRPRAPMVGEAHPAGDRPGPALHDARSIAERISQDEAAADAARARYRTDGLPVLESGSLGDTLDPGESLHAIHGLAILEIGPSASAQHETESAPRGGSLYLTSRRLIHDAAGDVQAWRLGDIREMSVSLERLLLVQLRDGWDLAVEVTQPRLLRVQIAAAIAAMRGDGTNEPGPRPAIP